MSIAFLRIAHDAIRYADTMGLPSFSIRRPVTVVMFFLGIVLFGLISWTRLQQELYPPITYPQLSVVTYYKDAAPEEMEILITKPVEGLSVRSVGSGA